MSTFQGNNIGGKPFVTRYIRPRSYDGKSFDSHGGVCVGVVIDDAAKELEFSLAVCNPKDRFRRSTAFSVLKGRLLSGDKYKLRGYNKGFSLVENVACALYSSDELGEVPWISGHFLEAGTELVSESPKKHPIALTEFLWAVDLDYEGTSHVE